jgi:hypothetical protein
LIAEQGSAIQVKPAPAMATACQQATLNVGTIRAVRAISAEAEITAWQMASSTVAMAHHARQEISVHAMEHTAFHKIQSTAVHTFAVRVKNADQTIAA